MVNKALLYLLADIGLLDRDDVGQAKEGQQLLRCVCPVHEGADNPTSFVLKGDVWFCNSARCHEEFGKRLEGLIVGLAYRHDGNRMRFKDALAWVKKKRVFLRDAFADWHICEGAKGTKPDRRFPCRREWVVEALSIPSMYFMHERPFGGFQECTLRNYDIGEPRRGQSLFANQRDFAIVPLYDLAGSGQCVGYAARSRSAGHKGRWRMSRGLPNSQRLFNYQLAKTANRETGQLVLVEGVPDALRCVEAGFPQAVAVLGSDLYDDQLGHLLKLNLGDVVVMGDNDEAGKGFARKVRLRLADRVGCVRVVRPPTDWKDIGDMRTAEARELLLGNQLTPVPA